jgi:hypothetical protein
MILESELRRYMQALPDAVPDLAEPPSPATEAALKHKRRPRRASPLPAVIEFIKLA